MAQLSIKHVAKIYPNGYQAIKNANVTIESGEFTVFVGPSGCGKSTLLRMIAGLETISGGEITLGERVLNDIEPADRDIAMVFQNYALYPHMSVYKNLAYGLINRRIDKAEIERRVKEAANMLQLDEYLTRKPSELSGGQRQRVAMGRAIVREPKAFLFDEPLSNLDAKLRNTMRLEIKRLQQRLNITSVYVTHDQIEAMTMADKIVVINKGNIEQVGTPQEIYHQPNNLFVATFMGSPAMNTLTATGRDGNIVFDEQHKLPVEHVKVDNADALNSASDGLRIGIRPEHIEFVDASHTNAIHVHIDVIEDLGAHRIVHASLGEQSLTCMTSRTDLSDQQSVALYFPPEYLYVFDAATGVRI